MADEDPGRHLLYEKGMCEHPGGGEGLCAACGLVWEVTIQQAAEAVCRYCDQGWPLTDDGMHENAGAEDDEYAPSLVACGAEDIWELKGDG